jgi:hypothetical protein
MVYRIPQPSSRISQYSSRISGTSVNLSSSRSTDKSCPTNPAAVEKGEKRNVVSITRVSMSMPLSCLCCCSLCCSCLCCSQSLSLPLFWPLSLSVCSPMLRLEIWLFFGQSGSLAGCAAGSFSCHFGFWQGNLSMVARGHSRLVQLQGCNVGCSQCTRVTTWRDSCE